MTIAPMPRLTERTAERLATTVFVSAAAIGLAGAVLTVVAWGDLAAQDSYPNLGAALAGVVLAALGTLIVRRVHNLVGWILLWVGLGWTLLAFISAYTVVGSLTHPGSLPGAETVGAVAEGIFVATAISLGFMLFVFPTGELPSARWRPIVGFGLVAAAVTVIGIVVVPAQEKLPAPGGVSLVYANPLRLDPTGHVLSTALVAAAWLVVFAIGAAFFSLVIRYRTGGSEQRQQIKWVAFTAATALALNVGAVLALLPCHCDSSPVATGLLLAEGSVVLIGLPAAFTIAILKHRLYEIDVVINRAVVYAVIAAGITVVYVGVVVGIGTLVGSRGSPVLTIAAAVVVALVFQPLRQQARRLANRLVYGERASPYEVLSEFADRMADTVSLDHVLQRMSSILAAGTGATRVDVWLRFGGELRSVARWPADAAARPRVALEDADRLPAFEELARVVAVRHGDELLGALAIEKPPSEPLSPTEEKLVEDLASQAGLVLRNVRLTADLQASLEDLRASRHRLVEAQDLERRRIERNLHDGAQQQLVALAVQLGLLERVAEDPERVKALTERIKGGLQDALDDLRDLARGIYPPLLADKGLAAALEAQARKAAIVTTVEADGVGRYPQDVEAAVYFCALEALQNVAKYAQASSAVVRLSRRNGELVFRIEDDGRGFDAAHIELGSGLQGMADRLDAIGGSLEVRSAPGEGTVVTGSIRATERDLVSEQAGPP